MKPAETLPHTTRTNGAVELRWHIDRLVRDEWRDRSLEEIKTVNPALEDVYQAVAVLDAKAYTILSVFGGNESYLSVGGGTGKYVVYASMRDEQLWNLLGPGDVDNLVVLNVGGQEGEYPARQVVDQMQVLRAVETFFDTGALDPSQHWEEQE